jgi:hypothetical protein
LRQQNWAIALQNQISQFNEKPFAWGTHDCFTFAADCVLAMTGEDKMAKRRGKYKTELGANKMLKKIGGVEKAITSELGEPIDPKLAQRGDVVCFITPLGYAAGICIGSKIAAPGFEKIKFSPMTQAVKAWSI